MIVEEIYPAKSTKCSLALRMVAEPVSLPVTCIVNMQCDRVEAWFIGVWNNSKMNYSILLKMFFCKSVL